MVSRPLDLGLDSCLLQVYFSSQASHSEICLDPEAFSDRLKSIIEKYLGSFPSHDQTAKFIDTLFTGDLYLSIACAQANDNAWRRFYAIYRQHIYNVALWHRSVPDWARDFTDGILADLFFPDKTGRSRIAGYEGRNSLAYWLAAIVKNRAINENALRRNTDEPLEDLPDRFVKILSNDVEASLRSWRYGPLIKESFRIAYLNLTDQERLIMRLHYEKGMKFLEIAKLLGETRPTVSRHFQALHQKLHGDIVSELKSKHKLSEAAIKECLEELIETRQYSIPDLIGSD